MCILKRGGLVASWMALATLSGMLVGRADEAPEPILRIDTGGHSSFVTSLAWSPTGEELISAGWDKLIRSWRENEAHQFVSDPQASIRLPIGPGPSGKLDALALSADGRWLAMGGYASLAARAASFRHSGIETALSSIELLEQGVIYVLDRQQNRMLRLEGHRGPVCGLAFATNRQGTLQLVSAGFDRNAQQQPVGSLRIWDVAQGKYLAGILLPETPPQRATIAAFPASGSASGLQVLAAWGSGKIYQWETTGPKQHRAYSDGMFNSLSLATGTFPWLLTASANNQTNAGQIEAWKIDGAGLPVRDPSRRMEFPAVGNELYLPLAATILPKHEATAPRLIVVALCVLKLDAAGHSQPDRIQLRGVSAPDERATWHEVFRRDLWRIEGTQIRLPELAASPTGNYLAIAGNPTHQIELFKVSELQRSQSQPIQLGGNTTAQAEVEFVDRPGELGLRLKEATSSPAVATQSFVFNLTSSTIDEQNTTTWTAQTPDLRGWSAARSENDASAVELRQGGVIQKTVRVPPRHVVSSFVLTAPLAATDAPLLLLAAHEEGQPWLGVSDARDGVTKRIFTAHTEPILSMAVSADSRLLATTSSDQTLAVWDLSDVAMLLKPRATLSGLALVTKDQSVLVEGVGPLAANRSPWRAGDQLLGYLDTAHDGLLQPWNSTEELNLSLWGKAAGEQISIRRKRANAISDVSVTLDQAVHESKPLFQLMITRPTVPPGRRWIGWSPLGPFDASDQEIRSHLGWHFNVLKPDRPVGFAPLDQYPELYQPGLLSRTIETLGKAVVNVPAVFLEPRLHLSLEAPQSIPWNPIGATLLREPPTALAARITNEEFPNNLIGSLTLAVDGQALGTFARSNLNLWRIDSLPAADWTRGNHRISVELLTNATPPRKFVIEQLVDYVPPPPTIELVAALPSDTKEDTLKLQARAQAVDSRQGYGLQLFRVTQVGDRQPLQTWIELTNTQAVDITLPLQEGLNQFELVATNQQAAADNKRLESASVAFEIQRLARDKNPPKISVAAIESNAGTALASEELSGTTARLVAGQSLIVDHPQIVIRGTVSAVEPLAKVSAGDETMPGFNAANSTEFEFRWPVELQPGPNKLKLSAATAVSPETTLEIDVVYREPLPDVAIVYPTPHAVISRILPSSLLEIRGLFPADPSLRPVRAVAIVDGQASAAAFAVDYAQGTITGSIPLTLGANSVQLALSNNSGAEAVTEPVIFHYQPRPIVEQRQLPTEIDKPTFEIVLSGTSQAPITRVLLDSRELSSDAWTAEQQGTKFTVRIAEVGWQADQRQTVVALFARGVDAAVFETLDVPLMKRRVSPPQLVFLSPTDNASVATGTLRIEFLARSQGKFSRLELIQDGQVVERPPIPAAKSGLESNIRHSVEVDLRPGVNTFQLLAENADGSRASHLAVNFVPSPVELQLHDLTSEAEPAVKLPLHRDADGTWSLAAPCPTARCIVTGSVRWSYADPKPLSDERLMVWVSVNGFKQPARLAAVLDQPLERKFACLIQLYKKQGNSIEISVPDLPELATSGAELSVDCSAPELMRQRLHLAIVGVGSKRGDEEQLMQEGVASMSGSNLQRIRSRKEFTFQSPAFAECVGYGPYTGAVISREKIGSLLDMIRLRIQQAQAREPANDVMLLYYRGGEQVNNGGQFYLTTQETSGPREAEIVRDPAQLQYFAVSSDSLEYFVDRCPGTQLLLLDVARPSGTGTPVGQSPNILNGAATFRYAWLKGQEVPADARLISAWISGPKALKLGQVEQKLSNRFSSLLKQYEESVSYESFLPPPLRDLVIGE